MKDRDLLMEWLPFVLGALVLAGLVHIVSILAVPWLSSQDAWSRLARNGEANRFTILPRGPAGKSLLPFEDPRTFVAACHYDLQRRPGARAGGFLGRRARDLFVPRPARRDVLRAHRSRRIARQARRARRHRRAIAGDRSGDGRRRTGSGTAPDESRTRAATCWRAASFSIMRMWRARAAGWLQSRARNSRRHAEPAAPSSKDQAVFVRRCGRRRRWRRGGLRSAAAPARS